MSRLLKEIWPGLFLLAIIALLKSEGAVVAADFHIRTSWHETFQNTLSIVGWFLGALVFVKVTRLAFWELVVQKALGHPPPRLLMQLSNVLIFVAAIGCILTFTFDQSLTVFWTASGAVGIVLGFALRNLILDTFSGLAIHMEQPFKVGDWISCHTRFGDYVGRVEETNWRTTRLWTTSRNIVVIPNSFLTTTILSNFSMPDVVSRQELQFTLDFAIPAERAFRVLRAAVLEAADKGEILSTPVAKVFLNHADSNGFVYRVKYYINPEISAPQKARDAVMQCVKSHFDHSGLLFSYPRQELTIERAERQVKGWEEIRDRALQLKKLSIFTNLTDEDLRFIAERLKIEVVTGGTTIVNQGDSGDSMFILAEGLLDVRVTNEAGKQVKVGTLSPGSFFGEKSMLTGEVRSASITTVSESVVCELTRDVISDLMAGNPTVGDLLSLAVIKRDLATHEALSKDRERGDDQAIAKEAAVFLKRMKAFFGIG